MRFKFFDIKSGSLIASLMAVMLLGASSCTDDLLYDPTIIGEGEAAITADLNFYEINSRL